MRAVGIKKSKCQKQPGSGSSSSISMEYSCLYRGPSNRKNSQRKRARNIRSESEKRSALASFASNRSGRHRSVLFVTQSDHGIKSSGAACGKPSGKERHNQKKE